jgi:hypothetical protein
MARQKAADHSAMQLTGGLLVDPMACGLDGAGEDVAAESRRHGHQTFDLNGRFNV